MPKLCFWRKIKLLSVWKILSCILVQFFLNICVRKSFLILYYNLQDPYSNQFCPELVFSSFCVFYYFPSLLWFLIWIFWQALYVISSWIFFLSFLSCVCVCDYPFCCSFLSHNSQHLSIFILHTSICSVLSLYLIFLPFCVLHYFLPLLMFLILFSGKFYKLYLLEFCFFFFALCVYVLPLAWLLLSSCAHTSISSALSLYLIFLSFCILYYSFFLLRFLISFSGKFYNLSLLEFSFFLTLLCNYPFSSAFLPQNTHYFLCLYLNQFCLLWVCTWYSFHFVSSTLLCLPYIIYLDLNLWQVFQAVTISQIYFIKRIC